MAVLASKNVQAQNTEVSNAQTYSKNCCTPAVVPNTNSTLTITSTGSISWNNTGTLWAATGVGSSGTTNTGTTINNSGTISNNSQTAILSKGNQVSINNVTTSSQIIARQNAIFNSSGTGTLGAISNAGTISSTSSNAINNSGTISTLTNTGTITAISAGFYGILNGSSSTISTLNNAQAGLTYRGRLPTNYNNIINSQTYYGQLAVTSGTGSTTFGIHADSILSATTYASALSGVASSSITNFDSIFNVWNNFNSSYKWQLAQGTNATTWDLLVALLATNITSPGVVYQSSNLGTAVNPVFDGGTLRVFTAGSIAPAFTITTNNGTIDQNGVASNFTGNITNGAAGVNGKLTIINTGTAGSGVVALSGTNTHSGGTEVQVGANLSIASGDALGSGTLALIGSATVPATLTTTATTTIANAITVSGDPVFNVAPGTTTTVTSPITDGVSSGDVVVTGGGTLALTAANTYTGPTSVIAGSTLALSGDGAIAPSNLVTNNGNFNITGKIANVRVTSYTQGSTGTLAMNVSPTDTQQLIVTGAASLAGGLSLTGSAGTYRPGKYSLLTANGVSGTFGSFSSNLSSLTTLGYSLSYDASNVYLIFTPNVADTQQSLVNTASVLQNTYTLQNSVLANSFSYDCTEFGTNGICISVGGRNTAVSSANGLKNTSGLLIAAYRPHPNYRLGAYADENLSVSNPGGTVSLGNNTPLIGLFGAWNERLDGTGTEVKVSAAYGQKNATVTRSIVSTSEPGSGSSRLNSQGAQLTVKYGFAVTPAVIVSPYVGVRYTQNNMNGYTEGTSSTVTAPLTYAALNTDATTALAGVGASYKVIPALTTFASAGVETDTNTANGTYTASNASIGNLTPVNFNANPVRTRPTAMVGASYEIEKNQRVGITGIYRQEAYQAVSTTTVMATYTVGL